MGAVLIRTVRRLPSPRSITASSPCTRPVALSGEGAPGGQVLRARNRITAEIERFIPDQYERARQVAVIREPQRDANAVPPLLLHDTAQLARLRGQVDRQHRCSSA